MKSGKSLNPSDKNTGMLRTGRMKAKLLRAYFSIALVGMAALLLILGYLLWDQNIERKEQHHTGQMARGASQTLVGIHRSLSALRAWILLGDPVFKTERQKVWKSEIYPALHELQDLNRKWGDIRGVAQFQEIETLLKDLENEQWWIEDVARTPGNEPAHLLLTGQGKTLAKRIHSSVSTMIDIEKTLSSGKTQKRLMGHMADFRAYFIQSHTNMSFFVSSGSDEDEYEFNQHFEIVHEMQRQIEKNKTILNARQSERFIEMGFDLQSYEEIASHIIDLRRSDQWNLAKHWLGVCRT